MRYPSTRESSTNQNDGVAVPRSKLAKMMFTQVRQGMGITDESINELELFKKKDNVNPSTRP